MRGDEGLDESLRYGMYIGVVVDREDPDGLGRVRVMVPALLEPASGWAWPLGTVGGGSKDRGFFAVPEVGAEVGVLFALGDVDHPYYLAAHWGAPGGESEVPAEAGGSPDVRVIATDSFRIVIDERVGRRQLAVIDRATGDGLEIDAETHRVTLRATSGLHVESTGPLSIESLALTLNGRSVRPGIDPI